MYQPLTSGVPGVRVIVTSGPLASMANPKVCVGALLSRRLDDVGTIALTMNGAV